MSLYNSFIKFAKTSPDIIITGENKEFGLVFFDKESLHLCFQVEDKDPNFLRILLPITIDLDNNSYKQFVELSTNVKVGKVIVAEDRVWFAVEQFMYDLDSESPSLYRRMIGAIEYMFNQYKIISSNATE